MEMFVMAITLVVCGFGVCWFLYDLVKTYKAMEEAYKESTLGKEEEEQEEE